MTREQQAIIAAVGYAASMIVLGASWWRACLVAIVIGLMFYVGWGSRWISKGMIAIGAVAALVFLQAIPPPAEWQGAAKTAFSIAKGE